MPSTDPRFLAPLRTLLRLGFVASALAGGLACSSGAAEMAAGDESLTTDEAPEGSFDTDTDRLNASVTFWSLDGEVTVTGGAPDLSASTFGVGIWQDATSRLCELVPTLGTLENDPTQALVPAEDMESDTAVPVEDPEIYAAWHITWTLDDPGCPWSGPDDLILGIGALDDALMPAVSANALDPSRFYGLYISSEGSATYVFGVAGTTEQYDGLAAPAATAPLADGVYRLQGLHFLPFELR